MQNWLYASEWWEKFVEAIRIATGVHCDVCLVLIVFFPFLNGFFFFGLAKSYRMKSRQLKICNYTLSDTHQLLLIGVRFFHYERWYVLFGDCRKVFEEAIRYCLSFEVIFVELVLWFRIGVSWKWKLWTPPQKGITTQWSSLHIFIHICQNLGYSHD